MTIVQRGQKNHSVRDAPLGVKSSNNVDNQHIEEVVVVIPVEDILSINFSTNIKKEVETTRVTDDRALASSRKLDCCDRLLKRCRNMFCCC